MKVMEEVLSSQFMFSSSVSQTLMCMQMTWGLGDDADSNPVGLGRGLKFCIFNRSQMVQML